MLVATLCGSDCIGIERMVALDNGFDDSAVIERMEPAGTSTSRVAARDREPPPMYVGGVTRKLILANDGGSTTSRRRSRSLPSPPRTSITRSSFGFLMMYVDS